MPLDLKPWQLALLLVSFGICVLLLIGGINVLTSSERLALEERTSTPKPSLTLILTATPSPSATPTQTATRSPLATSTSIPSPTPTPPAILRPTLSPTPVAAPIPSQTPSPTPAPQPSARLVDALRHQTNGDYKEAITAYLVILEHDPTPAETRQARFYLAESYLLNREAIPLLQLYVNPETVLADMAYEWIGDCHGGDQSFEQALAAYRVALDVTRAPDIEARLREKLASIYLVRDEYDTALAEYEAILRLARSEQHRARIEYMAGQVLAAMDHPADAYTRYQRAVESSPESEFAYLSLLELEESGEKVDEFQAGLGYYYAGKSNRDAYGAAIRAFDRYLAQEQVPKADEALYYKALAQQAIGHTSGALATLESIILEYPRSPWLERAWFEKAVTLARVGSASQAVKTCQEMVDLFPASDLTPQTLWQVANLREEAGALAQAARLYRDLQTSFPGFEHADEALWQAGIISYLAHDLDEAAVAWQDLADTYFSSPFSARALPYDYYALRAAQIRSRTSLTSSRFVIESVGPSRWDANEAEAQLLHWLGEWAEIPTSTDTSPVDLTATLGQQARLDRARALLEIGLRKEAIAESESALSAAWNDPLALGRLAFFFHDQDLHGLAARCAIRLAALWPEGRLDDAPQTLRRLAYPLAYTGLLSAESQKRNLDPLLLASLIRQESLFEPSAESSAGARGLSQVMPATGRQLARFLGMDDYSEDDLSRPSVSIEFGAFYLVTLLQVFDDQILVALVAYNGGPGNAQRWLDAVAGDLDLFVETIPAEESRRFLRRVYEGYVIYETLYRAAEPSE